MYTIAARARLSRICLYVAAPGKRLGTHKRNPPYIESHQHSAESHFCQDDVFPLFASPKSGAKSEPCVKNSGTNRFPVVQIFKTLTLRSRILKICPPRPLGSTPSQSVFPRIFSNGRIKLNIFTSRGFTIASCSRCSPVEKCRWERQWE